MIFNTNQKSIKCKSCGYIAYSPFPEKCPKCQKTMNLILKNEKIDSIKSNTKKQKKRKAQNNENHVLQFAKNIRIKSNPNIIVSDISKDKSSNPEKIEMNIEKPSIKQKKPLKVKVKPKLITFDLDNNKIDLQVQGEYFRFFGIITEDRIKIYSSNKNYDYLLELGANLEFIATSILSGELDKMHLYSFETDIEEYCYFSSFQGNICILYGNIPDKKALWLMRQIRVIYLELLGSKNPSSLTKIDLYNLQNSLNQRLKYFLQEYLKLQSVFTSNEITSVDDFLRIDFFGLSYQSIGVLSKLVTDELDFSDLPIDPERDEISPEIITELKEGQITAKLEAMAANCVANTEMMPNWISVKLGFQRYRFIIFSKVEEYYISLLTEGNLEFQVEIINELKKRLNTIKSKHFVGELKPYYDLLPEIVSFIKSQNIHKTQ